MRTTRVLRPALSCLLACLGSIAAAPDLMADTSAVYAAPDLMPETSAVYLPCDAQSRAACVPETIHIPNGRPIYALLVSGYHQNKQLDMFHWYNFAKCLQEKGAYVHYAWWNNLLAPYMEKPLHNTHSVPSHFAIPVQDLVGFLHGMCRDCFPSKALPAEDYQFQEDATALLDAIRKHNPDAAIILVGHSMGGGAIARLADNTDVDIALFAPIDPVGNRTCLWNVLGYHCSGLDNFKRFYAMREDQWWLPPRRRLGDNIKYLYHRWQQEFNPPFDYACPQKIDGDLCVSPIPLPLQDEGYRFDHPAPHVTSIHGNSTNVQAIVPTSKWSGHDVHPNPPIPNSGGYWDGHGEIVGFRGVKPISDESTPMALTAQGDWPARNKETDLDDENDPVRRRRVEILKAWEADPDYLRDHGLAPMAPDLCMVSDDMCTILETKVVRSVLRADAGLDQTVFADDDCFGQVTLDGTGSTHPGRGELTYTWTWNDGADEATGPNPTIELPLGSHEITLVVSDGQTDSDPDTVMIAVALDVTPPVVESPYGSPCGPASSPYSAASQ